MTIQAAGIVPAIQLHHRLRIARELTRLDAQSFAADIGISRNAVNRAERGETVPRELTLRAWALRTGVDLNWLKDGEIPTPDGDGIREYTPRDSNPEPAVLGFSDVVRLPVAA